MKNLFALFLIVGITLFISCGPSKNEKEIKAKAKKDSIIKDSILKVKKADSIAVVEKEKRKRDSLRIDSVAKAKIVAQDKGYIIGVAISNYGRRLKVKYMLNSFGLVRNVYVWHNNQWVDTKNNDIGIEVGYGQNRYGDVPYVRYYGEKFYIQ